MAHSYISVSAQYRWTVKKKFFLNHSLLPTKTKISGQACMKGLGEFSLEMLLWDTNEKFKNRRLAGKAVVWTGGKDMEVKSIVMKPQQWRSHGSVFRPRKAVLRGFPGGSVVKNLPANARDTRDVGSIPGSGRSPGWGYGNPFQYFCLENPKDRGAWWAAAHGVAKNWTLLKWPSAWLICQVLFKTWG